MSRRWSQIGDAVPNPYQVTLAAIIAFCLLMALAPAAGATQADGNSGPTANATANSSTVGLVEVVTLDASGSTDSDGSIESYEWDVDGDGEVEATGATTNYSYDSPGTYSATVTVTDDSGNTDSATVDVTVNVEPDYLEGNSWKGAGTDIGEYANYDNLTLHNRDDEDFFIITPETDGEITVDVSYDHRTELQGGDLEVEIMEYNDYDLLAEGISDSDDEYASAEVDSGERYMVKVYLDQCRYRNDATGEIVDCGENYWSEYDIEISAPNSAPSADAAASSSTVGLNETVTLDANGSNDPDDPIESYEWDIDGDGDVEATGPTPEVSYDSIGTYDATVTVTDRRGQTDSATVTVTVDDGLDANAAASSSAVGVGETVTLDASGSTNTNGAIESYEWDVDGDGETEATGATNDYSYDSVGTYDATVNLTNDDGYTDSATVIVTVDEGPAADATASSPPVTVGETVTLDASGSSDPDGSIESYEWDVDGDGEIEATGATNDYSYDSAGRYDATVTVTDVNGTTDSATVTVAVEQPSNSAPTANATTRVSTAVVGQTLLFDASNSTDSDGYIESYEWDIDGDGEIEATGAVHEVSYDSAGTYNATVTVTDDGLATDTATVTITVGSESEMFELNNERSSATDIHGGIAIDGLSIASPQDNDYYALELDEGETVTASIEFDQSDGDLGMYLLDDQTWPGSDRGISEAYANTDTDNESLSWTANEAGTYYVFVFGNADYGYPQEQPGETNSYNLSISTSGGKVGAPGNSAPTASATANSSTVTVNETVTLDASGSTDLDGSIESYEWDVDGDGETEATGATNGYSYDSAGTYDATVTVTDDDGDTDDTTVTVTVEEAQGQSQSMSDAVDADDDGSISDEEILNALDYWQDNEPVPGTGGESISDQEILDLIVTWQQADSG